MPTIEFSSAMANRVSSAYLTISSGVGSFYYSTIPIICNITDLYLCSGVRPAATPTNAELNAAKLVLWYHQADLSPTTRTDNTVIVNTNANTATASGTATWFCLTAVYGGVVYSSVTGNVGLTGSGADLEIANTSISSGTQYRVSGLILTLPTSWTY